MTLSRFALALSLAASACRPATDSAETAARALDPGCYSATGEYRVFMTLDAVHGATQLLVNGFPLSLEPGAEVIAMAAPNTSGAYEATPALVTGRNEITTAVVPVVAGRGVPTTGPAQFHSWVCSPDGTVVPGTWRDAAASDSAFAAWRTDFAARWPRWQAMEDSLFAAQPALRDSVEARLASDADAAYMGVGPALAAARAWARAHPVAVTAHFTRPGGARPTDGQPSFDALFRGVPVLAGTAADSVRLRAYAVRLRDLNAARDTTAMLDAFAPEIADGYPRIQVSRRIRESQDGLPDPAVYARNARAGILVRNAELFEGRDVGLRSWAGGRVWELYRAGADGLLQEMRPGEVRGPYWRVYVAEVDGRLHVVRT